MPPFLRRTAALLLVASLAGVVIYAFVRGDPLPVPEAQREAYEEMQRLLGMGRYEDAGRHLARLHAAGVELSGFLARSPTVAHLPFLRTAGILASETETVATVDPARASRLSFLEVVALAEGMDVDTIPGRFDLSLIRGLFEGAVTPSDPQKSRRLLDYVRRRHLATGEAHPDEVYRAWLRTAERIRLRMQQAPVERGRVGG